MTTTMNGCDTCQADVELVLDPEWENRALRGELQDTYTAGQATDLLVWRHAEPDSPETSGHVAQFEGERMRLRIVDPQVDWRMHPSEGLRSYCQADGCGRLVILQRGLRTDIEGFQMDTYLWAHINRPGDHPPIVDSMTAIVVPYERG